jgi:hypothetical protein
LVDLVYVKSRDFGEWGRKEWYDLHTFIIFVQKVISRSWLPSPFGGRKPAGITNGTRITSTAVKLGNGAMEKHIL